MNYEYDVEVVFGTIYRLANVIIYTIFHTRIENAVNYCVDRFRLSEMLANNSIGRSFTVDRLG